MRKLLLLLACVLAGTGYLNAQNFKESLQKTYDAFEDAKDIQAKVDQSNRFSLIAKKWSDEWSAHYYNAFSKTVLSYNESNEAKRDAYLDEAEKELEETVTLLKKQNDETYVLAAMIANARLAVKPQARWQKYGKIFDENLAQAKKINADNPRIYYLQGISKRHTPKMFGGGKKAALPYFEKASVLFAKQADSDITSVPTWGKKTNEDFLKEARGGGDDE